MTDIELVIKIDEEIYQHYKKVWQKRRGSIPESCIAFGTPLPKGHGDLIDVNDIKVIELEDSLHRIRHERGDEIDVYIEASTIVEADRVCGEKLF